MFVEGNVQFQPGTALAIDSPLGNVQLYTDKGYLHVAIECPPSPGPYGSRRKVFKCQHGRIVEVKENRVNSHGAK